MIPGRQTNRHGETEMCYFEHCHTESATSYSRLMYGEVTTQATTGLAGAKYSVRYRSRR